MFKPVQRFFKNLSGLFILSSLLYPLLGMSMEVPALYQAKVAVQTESATERATALKQALATVFIKVSGNSQIVHNPAIQEQINNPGILVEQYTYQALSLTNATHAASPQLWLFATFNGDAIKQLILKNGFAVWGADRPAILIWLLAKESSGPHFITHDTQPTAIDALQQQAQQRGLPIVLPLLDLVDLNTITLLDVETANVTALNLAAQRYAADGTAVATISQIAPQQWQAMWTLMIREQTQQWTVTGETLAQVLDKGVDNISNNVAERYGVNQHAELQAPVILKITQINSASAYRNVLHYLRSLAAVKSLQVVKIDESAAYFKLELLGSRQNLVESLNLNKQLIPENAAVQAVAVEETKYPDALPSPTMDYQQMTTTDVDVLSKTDYVYQWVE